MRLTVAALTLVAMSLLMIGTGSAQEPGPALPERSYTEPAAIELLEQTTFVSPEDLLGIALGIDGLADDVVVEVDLHTRVTSRIQFGQTLAGDELGSPQDTLPSLRLSELPRGDEGEVRLALPIVSADDEVPENALRITEPGVYPLVVRVLDPVGEEIDRLVTHIVRLPADDDVAAGVPLQVSLVVPIAGPPVSVDETGWPEPLTATQLQPVEHILEALSDNPDMALTVSALPQTVRQMADSPETGQMLETLRTEVREPHRQLLEGPWTVLDMSTWAEHDLLTQQLDAGRDTLSRYLGKEPSPLTWLGDETLSPTALSEVVDRGAAQVVLPERLLDPSDLGDRQVTMTERFTVVDAQGRRVPALQTDRFLEELLVSSEQPALVANRVLADLSVLARDLPDLQRQAVLRTPDDGRASAATALIIEELSAPTGNGSPTEPILVARTLDELLDGPDPAQIQRGWNHSPPQPLSDYLGELADVRELAASLASALADAGAPVLSAVDELVLASADRRLDGASVEILETAGLLVDDALGPIHIPEQGDITLTDTEGVIPLAVDSDLDDMVTVRVHVRADRLELPGGQAVEVVLEPGHNRLELEVQARASGAFPVEVLITTPDDRMNLASGRFTVRSTAVSGLGLVLSLCAGLFLAVWWIRNIRSARRRRRLVPSASHPANRAERDQSDTLDP